MGEGLRTDDRHIRDAAWHSPMSGVTLHLYHGDPPRLSAVLERTAASDSSVYLTANSAVELMRLVEGLRPSRQMDADGVPLLTFNRAIRQIMGSPTLSRAEERVLFRRAIRDLGLPADEEVRLRRDTRLWVDALAEIDA